MITSLPICRCDDVPKRTAQGHITSHNVAHDTTTPHTVTTSHSTTTSNNVTHNTTTAHKVETSHSFTTSHNVTSPHKVKTSHNARMSDNMISHKSPECPSVKRKALRQSNRREEADRAECPAKVGQASVKTGGGFKETKSCTSQLYRSWAGEGAKNFQQRSGLARAWRARWNDSDGFERETANVLYRTVF